MALRGGRLGLLECSAIWPVFASGRNAVNVRYPMKPKFLSVLAVLTAITILQGCTHVAPYQRGALSKTEMSWTPDHQDAPSSTLLALSTAAMALPALTPQAHAVAPTERTLSYRYTQYNEMGIDAEKVSSINVDQGGGANQRYDIDINQYAFSTPVGDHFSVSIDVQDEVLTGATPWTVAKEDVKGTPSDSSDDEIKLVMSGATIKEHRTEANLGTTYYYSSGTISGTLGVSKEDDYESASGGISWGGEFDDKQTGVALGISYSDDTLDPEEGSYKGTELESKIGGWLNGSDPVIGTAKKQSTSGFISTSRILSPNWIVQGGMSYTQKSGHLSD
ncbi:MAG: DUF3570 domain-containing protein, partial [Cytophagaceae bacterium]